MIKRMVAKAFRWGIRTAMQSESGGQSYHAAAGGRRTMYWNPSRRGPHSAATHNINKMLARSRDAARNNEWVRAAIETTSSEAIGVGIKPKSLAPTEELREAIQSLWTISVDEMDADGVLDFYALQDTVYREFYEVGEVFGRLRYRMPEDGLAVPLQIQLIESEQVPHDFNDFPRGGPTIISGIELGPTGKRDAFWLYRHHPGETLWAGANIEKIRVPASEMVHVFKPERAGQLRGVPRIATMLSRIHDIQKLDDAALLRAQVATLFVGVLKKPDKAITSDINPLTGRPFDDDMDDDDTPLAPMEAGSFLEVPEGYETEFTDPPDLGRGYKDFIRYHLMAAGGSLGMSYELLTGDLQGVSDRALRLLLQRWRRRLQMEQHGVIAFQFCRPIWNAWMDMAVMLGRFGSLINIDDYVRNRRLYQAVKWTPHAWPYIHPVQDVDAAQREVLAGFASRADKVSDRGEDVEQIDKQNRDDNARARGYGLRYSTSTDAAVQATAEEHF